MATTALAHVPLIHEAIAGFRRPYRFARNEPVLVWVGGEWHPAVVKSVWRGGWQYTARVVGGGWGVVWQYDLRKLDAVESSREL